MIEIAAAKSLPPLTLGMVALMPGFAIAAWVGVPLSGNLSLCVATSAAAAVRAVSARLPRGITEM